MPTMPECSGCLFDSRISSRQPYFAGGGLPVSELGLDPRAVLTN